MDEIDLEIQQLEREIAALESRSASPEQNNTTVQQPPSQSLMDFLGQDTAAPFREGVDQFSKGAIYGGIANNLGGAMDWANRQVNNLSDMVGLPHGGGNPSEALKSILSALDVNEPNTATSRVGERAGEIGMEIPKFLLGGQMLKGAQGLGMVGRGIAKAGEFVQSRPAEQLLSALSAGTAGGLAKEGGATPEQQMGTELLFSLNPKTIKDLAGGVYRSVIPYVDDAAKGMAKTWASAISKIPGINLSRPIDEIKDTAVNLLKPAEASPGAIEKLVGNATTAPEARGAALQSGAIGAEATVGKALDTARQQAAQTFDSMARGDKAAAWRVVRDNLKRTARSLFGKGTSPEQKEMGKQLMEMAREIEGPKLKNGARAIDKQVSKWKAPSLNKFFEFERNILTSKSPFTKTALDALDSLADVVPEEVGGLMKQVKEARTAFREGVGSKSLAGKFAKGMGDVAEDSGVTLAQSPERVIKDLVSKGRKPIKEWKAVASKEEVDLAKESIVADLMADKDKASGFISSHKDALKELWGDDKSYYTFAQTFGSEKNSLANWIAKNSANVVRFAATRVLPRVAGGAIGYTTGASTGNPLVAGLGLVLGVTGGARIAGKSAERQGRIEAGFTKLIEQARDNPKVFAALNSEASPGMLKKLFKALGIAGVDVTPAMMGAIEGGYDENTDMGTESFPKKKLTSEPMTTSNKPEAKLAPVSYSPDLVKLQQAVIRQESGGNPTAVSRAGAQGLMQLMPETGKDMMRRLGLNPKDYDPYNPDLNKQLGTEYLRMLRGRYDGDVQLALAAYNWGMGNLEKAMKKHGTRDFNELVAKMGIGGRYGMPRETAEYVHRVLANLHKINTLEV